MKLFLDILESTIDRVDSDCDTWKAKIQEPYFLVYSRRVVGMYNAQLTLVMGASQSFLLNSVDRFLPDMLHDFTQQPDYFLNKKEMHAELVDILQNRLFFEVGYLDGSDTTLVIDTNYIEIKRRRLALELQGEITGVHT